ncbi:MAG TPA: conjugative transposon protein TraN [Panacibacter sp.]|nr:conjugative transposon protein TraN [Panacibacter sp.]
MKQFIILIFTIAIVTSSIAQQNINQLNITTQKTTSLIFPSVIIHTDIGSAELLVQKVEQATNILLIKAGKRDFEQTNLSVITADGNVYSFIVNYDSSQATFIYNISTVNSGSSHKVSFRNALLSQSVIETYANGILDNPSQLQSIYDVNWRMKCAITGFYIRGNILFIQVLLQNQSSINYDIDLMRFSIKDQRIAKRTASQEKDLQPVYVAGNRTVVAAGTKNVIVFAVPKFTIPEHQYLSFEVNELNGGRNLSLKVNNRIITRARQLPSFE